eukprot:5133966-Prymnesium_polylepis.1
MVQLLDAAVAAGAGLVAVCAYRSLRWNADLEPSSKAEPAGLRLRGGGVAPAGTGVLPVIGVGAMALGIAAKVSGATRAGCVGCRSTCARCAQPGL